MGKTTHGMSKTRFYKIFIGMKSRCYNKNNKKYFNYGGRGITICDEWLSDFMNFYNDMHESYKEHCDKYGEVNTTIDRIDVNGNYEPSNCRWADNDLQKINKTTTRYITINGITKSLYEWCKENNINRETLTQRMELGWSDNDLFKDTRIAIKIDINGKKYSFEELSKIYNLSVSTLFDRYYKMNLHDDDLLKPPNYYMSNKIEINGEIKTLKEWSGISGIKTITLRKRIQKGITGKDLLKPVRENKKLTFDGKTLTLSEWSKQTKIPLTTLYRRLEDGWDIELILTTKPDKKNKYNSIKRSC